MEKRKQPRQRTLLGGRLEFNKTQVYDCVVTNLSAEGAKVRCDGTAPLPPHMVLSIPAHGEKHEVKTVWRAADGFGFSFTTVNPHEQTVPSKGSSLPSILDQ